MRELIIQILATFAKVGLVFWAWLIVAPHLNAPTFTYWETFIIFLGIRYLIGTKNVTIENLQKAE